MNDDPAIVVLCCDLDTIYLEEVGSTCVWMAEYGSFRLRRRGNGAKSGGGPFTGVIEGSGGRDCPAEMYSVQVPRQDRYGELF